MLIYHTTLIAISFLLILLSKYVIKNGKIIKREKIKPIHSFFKSYLYTSLGLFAILSPVYISEFYYESDIYEENRKEEVLKAFNTDEVSYEMFDDSYDVRFYDTEDDYFEQITIKYIPSSPTEIEKTEVIFWANRDKLNEDGFNYHKFLWRIRSDCYFELGADDPNDIDIINHMRSIQKNHLK